VLNKLTLVVRYDIWIPLHVNKRVVGQKRNKLTR